LCDGSRSRTGTPSKSFASESGAALVVGLILMLVLTVLGVSGMNMNTLELTMASNTQSQADAFQAAETGIDIALAKGDFSTTAQTSIGPTNLVTDGSYSTEATVTFAQTTPVPDLSFSMGVGTGSVQAFHFDITANGTGPRGARATHTQSFYIVGPGGP
jgi:type IV pilus assembly protein PilX